MFQTPLKVRARWHKPPRALLSHSHTIGVMNGVQFRASVPSTFSNDLRCVSPLAEKCVCAAHCRCGQIIHKLLFQESPIRHDCFMFAFTFRYVSNTSLLKSIQIVTTAFLVIGLFCRCSQVSNRYGASSLRQWEKEGGVPSERRTGEN